MANAVEAYRAMVRDIGQGFHPDTPACEYSPPLSPEVARRYEAVIDDASRECDLYATALDVLRPCAS